MVKKKLITVEDKDVLIQIRDLHLKGHSKVEICRRLRLSMPQVSLAVGQMTTLGYFDPDSCKKAIERRYQMQVGRVRNFTLDTLTVALKNLIQQIIEMPGNRMRKEALKQELIEIEMEEMKRKKKYDLAVKKAKDENREPPVEKQLTEAQHRRALEIEAELEYIRESDIKVKPADILALTAALNKLHEMEKEVHIDDPKTVEGETVISGMTLVEAREIIEKDKNMKEQMDDAEKLLEEGIDLEQEFMEGFDEFKPKGDV